MQLGLHWDLSDSATSLSQVRQVTPTPASPSGCLTIIFQFSLVVSLFEKEDTRNVWLRSERQVSIPCHRAAKSSGQKYKMSPL